MHLPWQVYLLIMLAVAVLAFAWNTRKLRKQLGKSTTIEEIRTRHPNARLIWRSKDNDSK